MRAIFIDLAISTRCNSHHFYVKSIPTEEIIEEIRNEEVQNFACIALASFVPFRFSSTL